MRIFLRYFLILIALIANSCLPNRQARDSLDFIDVRKNYPVKELILSDFADVVYLHLNSDNDDYLYQGRIHVVTENTIIIYDNVSGSILFFSKDGNPKSRFNCKGQGPNEYTNIRQIEYDESTDDVFVLSMLPDIIFVYSSKGKYKRKLVLPKGTYINPFISFDAMVRYKMP